MEAVVRISFRNLVGAGAVALAVCAAGPSRAQTLTEFALSLLALNDPATASGPTIVGIQPSTALEQLCEAPGPEAEALCAGLDELSVGMPVTAAVAKFGGGLKRFVFEPLTETASKPLLIIAEDIEGEALGVTLGRQPAALADGEGPSRESRVLYAMIGEEDLALVTCAYRGRHELEHVVQQRAGVGGADAADGGPCADALQEALDGGHELGFATALADVDAILSCDVGENGPVVHAVQTADTGFCDGGANPDYCAAIDAIASGQPCAGALSSLLEFGAEVVGTPAVLPAVDRSDLLILREDDVLAIARDAAPHSNSTDLLFGLRGDGEPRLLACDFSRLEPVVTFEQPGSEESSAGEACATAIARGWDASQKVQIEPVARSVVGFGTFSVKKRMPRTASDASPVMLPGERIVYTIVVSN